MFISVRELELHEVEFSQEFQPPVIDFGADIRLQTPLRTTGRAQLLVEERHGKKGAIKDIRVVGDYSTRIEARCARCLEPVSRDLASQFDLLYRPLGVDAGPDERAVQRAETEIGYYRGEGLLLEDVLREQVLLGVPIKLVCSEQCRGMCPRCGQNLNAGQCVCPEPVSDNRWAALKDLREKLKS
jgi:uncharacterized protein